MAVATKSVVGEFQEQGFVKVNGVLDPEKVLDPIIEEYRGVLDNLARDLYDDGEIESEYKDLPFDERILRIYQETGRQHAQYFDFSVAVPRRQRGHSLLVRTCGVQRLCRRQLAGRARAVDRSGDFLQSGPTRSHQAAGEASTERQQRTAANRRYSLASRPRRCRAGS